jgi:hypothetical protein
VQRRLVSSIPYGNVTIPVYQFYGLTRKPLGRRALDVVSTPWIHGLVN